MCPSFELQYFFKLFLGQNSSAGKLKTLFGALDIMAKTKGAFQLIRRELVAESEQVNGDEGFNYQLPSLVHARKSSHGAIHIALGYSSAELVA